MKIYRSATELIGHTPLLELARYGKFKKLEATVLAKLEYLNPYGSVKDRVAAAMIRCAEMRGELSPGSVIIEPTSGNTGIALAAVAAAKGYKMIATMPETMSAERINILRAYGAQVILTDGSKGMSGAVEKAEELAKTTNGAFMPGQFTNPDNPQAHYDTTGPEIIDDADGRIDIFVAGVGTGGTLSGAGRRLKEYNADIRVVAVEPAQSPVLSQGRSGAHGIQGIGAGFVPDTLDTSVYDEVITVTDGDAFETAKTLGKTEGLLVGISSGAALFAASELAMRKENAGKNIVVIFPDSADRYYSTELFKNRSED